MIVDTSALMAILNVEPESRSITTALSRSNDRLLSAGSAVELGVVCTRSAVPISEAAFTSLIRSFRIHIVPVDEEQVRLAWNAFTTYGRGRHSAGLNYGDCFAYALAKQTGLPLLFKGDDFSKTDVPVAAW